jgi:hypothetical protein
VQHRDQAIRGAPASLYVTPHLKLHTRRAHGDTDQGDGGQGSISVVATVLTYSAGGDMTLQWIAYSTCGIERGTSLNTCRATQSLPSLGVCTTVTTAASGSAEESGLYRY